VRVYKYPVPIESSFLGQSTPGGVEVKPCRPFVHFRDVKSISRGVNTEVVWVSS